MTDIPLPQVAPSGPRDARIMIVGEAPGSEEVAQGVPFVGASGQELDKMLHEAGILRTECFLTTVARHKPPNNDIGYFFLDKSRDKAKRIPNDKLEWGMERLQAEIDEVQPDLILALGDTPLWALTGERGITKWRGSQLTIRAGAIKVVPTYNPGAVLRQWSWRPLAVHDLSRAKRWFDEGDEWKGYHENPNYIVRPTFERAMEVLDEMLARADEASSRGETLRLAGDIETRGGHIACFGFAWSYRDALCLPFMCVEDPEGYWPHEQEFQIVLKCLELFRHGAIDWIFQNGLYDYQYFARYWGCIPHLYMDTMLAHHTIWPALPKGLDVLSSLYCKFHKYWKDDGKTWNVNTPEEDLWYYNCDDCTRTLEVADNLDEDLDTHNLREQSDFQHEQFPAVLGMMLRGVRTSKETRANISSMLFDEIQVRIEWINFVADRPLNPKSSKQMQEFFYNELGLPVQRNRKTKRPSCDDKALKTLCLKEPLIRPLVAKISEVRSLQVFKSTFIDMPLDRDSRLRTSYNIAGTTTFRWSSSRNAFNSGGNLQNIPKGTEDDEDNELPIQLPNVKKLFLADLGFTIVECDLDRADAQVVACEANDEELRQIFREGADVHMENAKAIYGERANKHHRQLAKAGVHATNYGARARTLAAALGISVHEAERFQRIWFGAHPGIRDWHDRIEDSLQTTRSVYNAFGYRMFFFERIEKCFPEALAWVPQSTVALVIDKGIVNLHNHMPNDVEVLLQVHDSAIFQIETAKFRRVLPQAMEHLRIEVPYDDPLVIPVGAEASETSWGEVEKVDFV